MVACAPSAMPCRRQVYDDKAFSSPLVGADRRPEATVNDGPSGALVGESDRLTHLCDRWRHLPALALDTEFVRERTFYAQLALVQVHDGDACSLLDPLALDLAPFTQLLAEPGITKVLHGCSEDLDIFFRVMSRRLEGLFDTQIAATLCSPEGPVSYRRLVADYLHTELGADATRSNWLRRPLSAHQIRYAEEDVQHLLPLHEVLSGQLAALGRTNWAQEEFQRLTDPKRFQWHPEDTWLRFGARWKLMPHQLEALRRLAQWRDEEARRSDLPRTFVVKDPQLMQLAEAMPADRRALTEAADMHPREVRVYADKLLALIQETRDVPEADLPERPPRPDTSREARTVLKQMRTLVAAKAQELGIAPDVLAPARLLKGLFHRHYFRQPPPVELTGWRGDVITDQLTALLDDWRGR